MQSEKDALIERYAGDAFKNRNNNDLTMGVWRQHFVEFADKLAALSAADPVCCGKPVHEGSPEAYTLECCGKFVQSAPSVAVKALDAVSPDLLLYNLITEAVNEGVTKATDPDWTSKDFVNSPSYQAIHSALSAQVQDVAGWQPIETAPKDGSAFLAVMAKAYSPRATLCKFKDGKFLSPSQGEKFVLPGWNQWWPTHWMPLPAAPAKQEG